MKPQPNRALERSRRKHIAGIAVGSVLALAPLLGLLPTIFEMAHAFLAIFRSQPPPTPRISLGPEIVGIFLCPLGLVILIVSIILLWRSRGATAVGADKA